MTARRTARARPSPRAPRAFTLVELLIALAITAMLLVAMTMALQAAFRGYQASVAQSSTQVVARVVTQRVLAMVRTGSSFGPLPADAREKTVRSDEFTATLAGGETITVRLDRAASTLVVRAGNGPERTLLAGVRGPLDAHGADIGAFTLEFEKGTTLVRASFDLVVDRDPETQLVIEGDESAPLRLVGSASPRTTPW